MLFQKMGIEIRMWQLKKYGKDMEEHLSSQASDFESKFNKEYESLSKEEREEFADFHADTWWELTDVYPNTFRKSFFLTCYSTMEYELNSICNCIGRGQGLSLKTGDLGSKGLERSKKYLTKVLGVSFETLNDIWRKISLLNKIRNFIVHGDGVVDDSKNGRVVRDFSRSRRGGELILIKNNEIILKHDFCLEVIDDFMEFTGELSKIIFF